MTYETQKAEIVAKAEAATAAYPQYRGHWDGPEWFLVRVTRRVTTKMGIVFEPGDISVALADRNHGFLTVYSLRSTLDTSVPSLWTERLLEPLRCPTTPQPYDDDPTEMFVGCGSTNLYIAEPGLVDCGNCDIWFDPAIEYGADWATRYQIQESN